MFAIIAARHIVCASRMLKRLAAAQFAIDNDKVEKLTFICRRQDTLAQTFPLPEIPPYVIANLPDPHHPSTTKPFAIETASKFISPRSKKAKLSLNIAMFSAIAFIIAIASNPDAFWFPVLFFSSL